MVRPDAATRKTAGAEADAPRALIFAPPGPDLDLVLEGFGAGWELATAARVEDLDAIDPRTRLVVLDDRLATPVAPLARAALERATSARILVAAGPESMGDVLSAGLDGGRVAWLFRPLTRDAVAAELREIAGATEARRTRPESDRRAFPRAALEEPKVVAPGGVDLRDISPGGALLVAPAAWTVGSRIPLELRLTSGAPVQRVVAEVTRTEPAPLGRLLVAARFVEPSARFQSLVRATILEHMTFSELRKLFRRVRDEPSGCAPIVEPARIETLLREFRDHQRSCLVSVAPRGTPWRATLERVDPGARRLAVGRGGGRRVLAGDAIEVFVNCSTESYLLGVEVVEAREGELVCSWPDVLHYSEKRTNRRRLVPTQAGALVEIDAPPPWGTRAWPVRDLSSGGLSFVMSAADGVLLPGTPLRTLRLRVGDRVVAEHAGEIRHVAPLGDGTVLVGVGLLAPPRASAAAHPSGPARALPRRGPAQTPMPHTAGAARRRAAATPMPGVLDAAARAAGGAAAASASPADRPVVRAAAGPPSGRRVRFFNSRREVVSAILDTSVASDVRFSAPVVIVAPAFGRSKECFSTLARWLCDRFARQGQPIAVLRFDFTHSKGESFIPPANRVPGRECLDFTLSSALDDLRAAVRYVDHTPLFEATSVVLVGYSMSAPLAVRAAAVDPRVSHVVAAMGVPSFQDAVRSVTGGLDYVGRHRSGEQLGVVNLLGHLVDMDAMCADAAASRLATAHDTRRDVSTLPPWVHLSWLVGAHDGWVDERGIEDLLHARRRGARPDVIVLPTGHVPTESEEAAAVAEETTRLVWRTAHATELPPGPGPDPEVLERIAREEWARAPRTAMTDRRAYWADYLLGTNGELGYDVLESVGAYRDLMEVQVALLDARPGQVVLDAGGGTGNFLAALLDSARPLPARVELADLVPRALERARAKNAAAVARAGLAVEFEVKMLEVSRLRPVERFVRGEVYGPAWLRGRVDGLDDATLTRIVELYGAGMHAALRGGSLDPAVAKALSDHERAVVEELGRAARLVRGVLREDDFRDRDDHARARAAGAPPVRTTQLVFDHLALGDVTVDERLAFADDAYDRIIASLLLPYIANPDETVRELHRALRPGGKIVISSHRPNTDMSEIFTALVADVSAGRVPPPPGMDRGRFLDELRAYTNSAAFLLRLTDEQTFRFFTADQLRQMLEDAGFRSVAVRPSFGDPPQAHVAVGVKA